MGRSSAASTSAESNKIGVFEGIAYCIGDIVGSGLLGRKTKFAFDQAFLSRPLPFYDTPALWACHFVCGQWAL